MIMSGMPVVMGMRIGMVGCIMFVTLVMFMLILVPGVAVRMAWCLEFCSFGAMPVAIAN